MSLGEFLVVVIVSLLVMKPNDIPKLIASTRRLRSYLVNLKKELFAYIDVDSGFEHDSAGDIDKINFYIQEIVNSQGCYDGNYSLQEVKDEYNKLIKQQIDESGPDNLEGQIGKERSNGESIKNK